MKDTFKTIKIKSKESLFKDKNSKFYGVAYPVNSEEEVKSKLLEIKKKHPSAGHHCYAYQFGVKDIRYRANDDGEPNNSAGLPIYGQIKSFGLTNILVVSTRYFGGTKLGVSGLINAYRTSAKLTLETSDIVENFITVNFKMTFNYQEMSLVMKIIKEKNIEILNHKLEIQCEYIISVRENQAEDIYNLFNKVFKIKISKLKTHF